MDYETFLASSNTLETRTAAEIMDTFFFPRYPVIDGLIHGGTNFLAGAPKTGKSFMAMKIAYHVSMGIPLWGFPVRRGTVLYLALEDNEQRIQQRMNKMFGIETTKNLHFATCAEKISEGLEEQIKAFIDDHPDTALVIIDTLQKARPSDGGSYADDYAVISSIKKITDWRNVSILIVHHTRKMDAEDILDKLSGTNGLVGSADGAFILTKEKRHGDDGVLNVVSRDIQDMRLNMKFNRQNLNWELESIERELWDEPKDPFLDKIMEDVLGDRTYWEGTATEMMRVLGEDSMMPSSFTRRLNPNVDKIKHDYNVELMMRRTSEARLITLRRLPDQKRRGDANDGNDANSNSGYLKKSASFSSDGITGSSCLLPEA